MADRRRLLNDLRVIDLRQELEKRNLDKSGVRGVLIQRLSKQLEEEGHNPDTYEFEVINTKTPTKKSRRSGSTAEAEQDSECTPTIEDMIVQDDAGEDEELDQSEKTDNCVEASKSEPTEKMETEEKTPTPRKRENQDETEASEAKKPCIEKEEEGKENNIEEDSINLDLGEDELLNEETDNTAKTKKDDAATNDAATAPGDNAADTSIASADEPADNHEDNAEAPPTSTDGEKDDKDQKAEESFKDGEGDKKDKKDDSKEGGARNLWVSGLSGDTRAKDLKQLCSKHGKVIGAKVVTNARTPGSRCYGYVTMASAQDAENCIKNLHRTELHGRLISVEKAKSESESASRRQPTRPERHSSKDRKEDGKDKEETKDGEKTDKKEGEDGTNVKRSASRTRERSQKNDKDRVAKRNTRSRERKRSPLSAKAIWKERDVYRARERARLAREDERRRRAAEEALRERERRQREEKRRLQMERDKLRAERERIEREKNELLRLERERHRLEREKLELERLELKRAQLRLEEERRKRGYEAAAYRKAPSPPPPEPAYERDRHKRHPPPPPPSNRPQFEAPPPPRFEMNAPAYDRGDKRDRGADRERDYKRDYPRHVPASTINKYPSNGAVNDESRQPLPPSSRPKEPPSRTYESRDGRSYRPSPPTKPEPRVWNSSSRYPEPTQAPKGGSGNTGGNENWSTSDRYGGTQTAGYEARYPPAYQPPPPGVYPDRYPAHQREYRKY